MKFFSGMTRTLSNTFALTGFSIILAAGHAGAQISLVPLKENQKFTLIYLAPDVSNQTELSQGLQELEKDLMNATGLIRPKLLELLVDPTQINKAIVDLSSDIQRSIQPNLVRLNEKLPENKDILVSVYLTPFKRDENLKALTIEPAISDWQYLKHSPAKSNQSNSADHQHKYNQLSTSQMYDLIENEIKTIPLDRWKSFQVGALTFQLRLRKNNHKFDFQLLGFLKGGYEEFPKANEQVIINHFEVLTDPASGLTPTALVHVQNDLAIHTSRSKGELSGQTLPKLRMTFGGFKEIRTELQSEQSRETGLFALHGSTEDKKQDCKLKYSLVPTLFGSFAHKPTGNFLMDRFLHNRFVRFRILGLEFDPNSLRITNLEVATGLDDYREYHFLNCLRLPVVGRAFTDEANASIESGLKSLVTQDTATLQIMESIYE